MTAVRTLAGVVLQRATKLRECVIQLLTRGLDRTFTALMHIPSSCSRQADGYRLEFETTGDISGNVSNRTLTVRGQQDVATQIEQTGDFLFACLGFTRSLPNRSRELTGDHRHNHEHEQRHPILRVGDRQSVERRQQEEVKGQHRRHRDANRHAEVRRCRRGEHHQQEEQRCDRGVRTVLNRTQQDDEGHNGGEPCHRHQDIAPPLWPRRFHCATHHRGNGPPRDGVCGAPQTSLSAARPWVRPGCRRSCDSVS